MAGAGAIARSVTPNSVSASVTAARMRGSRASRCQSQAAKAIATAYAAKYEAEPWSASQVQSLIAEGRPIFIDFTASWCATCQVNKATTLKSKAVHDFFAANDVAFLVADFTRKDPAIAAELARHQRAGVPMYLWYPAGSEKPQVLPEILNPGLVTSLPVNP